MSGVFSDEARRAFYEILRLRRDVRHFEVEREVSEVVLGRILGAAHLAPSVGFSQPWRFVVVRNDVLRRRIRGSFLRCRETEAARFSGERREKYLSLKLEGIEEASLNLCVCVDLRPRGEAVLGTTIQPEAVRASAYCAVQNLWLAARAEGVGVGWVSIVEPAVLRQALALPGGVEPIAYLCLGYPTEFREQPLLEEVGWLPRRDLAGFVHNERWPENNAIVAEPSSRHRNKTPVIQARSHLDLLTKPKGSLGKLESIVEWYASAVGSYPFPSPTGSFLPIFAADHGCVSEGVSAYGSQNTAGMISNVLSGGAAINVLAKENQIELLAVDVGIAGDTSGFPVHPDVALQQNKIAYGTRNSLYQPAMTLEQAHSAFQVGQTLAHEKRRSAPHTLLGCGEIGIGNTTPAAALACVFTGRKPECIVGAGTGLGRSERQHKVQVVEKILAFHSLDPSEPFEVLAKIGGLELASLAGWLVGAAECRTPVVLDGFLTNVAALVACAIEPKVASYLLASHASAEQGAQVVLETLGLAPLFDFELRLGEGTGSAIALGLVRMALQLDRKMATFATAGLVGRAGTDHPSLSPEPLQ